MCKGIVVNRLLALKRNHIIENRTDASFGVLVRKRVRKAKIKPGRKTEYCTNTNQWFYVDSIEWLINQNTYEWDGCCSKERIFKGTELKATWMETIVRHDCLITSQRPEFLACNEQGTPIDKGVCILRPINCELPRSDIEANSAKVATFVRSKRLTLFAKKELWRQVVYHVRLCLIDGFIDFELRLSERLIHLDRIAATAHATGAMVREETFSSDDSAFDSEEDL